jgi:hypothetical protein
MFLFRYHDASAMKRAAAAKKQKPAKGKALQKNLIQWIERTLDSPLENGFVEGLKSGVVRVVVYSPDISSTLTPTLSNTGTLQTRKQGRER